MSFIGSSAMKYRNMGCISSKHSLSPNVFQVVNVDDYGNHKNRGQLEVTETELVFYQGDKMPIRWPLRTLRRYGCENDLFSFESGRRSPTGAGVYAFMCRRAAQIVALLETILKPITDNNDSEGSIRISHRLSSISSGGPLSPRGLAPPLPPPAIDIMSLDRRLSLNLYANEEAILAGAAAAAASQGETNNNKLLENATDHTYTNMMVGNDANDGVPSIPVYMNIVPGTENEVSDIPNNVPPPLTLEPDEIEIGPCYANLDLDCECDPQRRILNYITLDLEAPKSPTNSVPPDSPKGPPPGPPPGYATIDFERTTALSHSVDPSFDDSESLRKTRHNSQIADLPRHSSSVSD